jgi:hypothetical protein
LGAQSGQPSAHFGQAGADFLMIMLDVAFGCGLASVFDSVADGTAFDCTVTIDVSSPALVTSAATARV